MKVISSVLLVCVLSVIQAWAGTQLTVDQLVSKVDARYAQTEDLQAAFTQETLIEGFETGFASSGQVSLKKPGLLRWDYIEPTEEQIYVDGDQVMMYVPAHQQVLKGTLTQMAASKGPLALLQGVGKLSQQFTILDSPMEGQTQSKFPRLKLVPKPSEGQSPTIKEIVLTLFPDSYLIKTITLAEVSGNVTRVRFDELQVNKGLSASQLKFQLPPDVVVVDLPTLPQ